MMVVLLLLMVMLMMLMLTLMMLMLMHDKSIRCLVTVHPVQAVQHCYLRCQAVQHWFFAFS